MCGLNNGTCCPYSFEMEKKPVFHLIQASSHNQKSCVPAMLLTDSVTNFKVQCVVINIILRAYYILYS